MNNKKAIITLVTLLWLPCSLFGLQFDHSEDAIMGGSMKFQLIGLAPYVVPRLLSSSHKKDIGLSLLHLMLGQS